jgi:hypothetical protein
MQPMSPGKSAFFGVQPTLGTILTGQDRRQRTQLKAELVRKEVLSRRDLFKLYEPPIPKSQIPTANPFYTKTLVNPYSEKPQSAGLQTLSPTRADTYSSPYENRMSKTDGFSSGGGKEMLDWSKYQGNKVL